MDETTLMARTLLEMSAATNCAGGGYSDISAVSTLSYDEETRSLSIVPQTQMPASYSNRITIATGVADTSSNGNSIAFPHVFCVVLEERAVPPVPLAPTEVTLDSSPFSPDGHATNDEMSFALVADAAATAVAVRIRRSDTTVRILPEAVDGAGTYLVRWDGRNGSGRIVPNCHYAVELAIENAAGIASASAFTSVHVDSGIGFVGVAPRF
ncbi:MAG: hypothetical protein GY811_15305 [Myxococcales bacterium]|nr:hypothetical protein [Myxococcales bacterium]